MINVWKPSALLLLFIAFSASGRAQDMGYSYVQLIVNGHPTTTIFSDKKHTGWMQVMSVEATLNDTSKRSAGKTHARLWLVHSFDDGRTFSFLPKSGREGPDRLWFVVSDEEGIEPLVEAQKQKIRIASADLDLYSEETNRFMGRFQINGIRVLSFTNVPASACPKDWVTLSFESIAREP